MRDMEGGSESRSRKYFMEIETRHLKATSKQEVVSYYARYGIITS